VSGRIPAPRSGHSACVINGAMLIFGGFETDSRQQSQDVYQLDLNSMKWSYVQTSVLYSIVLKFDYNIFHSSLQGEPPIWREKHSATMINNKMYIFGGIGNAGPNDTV